MCSSTVHVPRKIADQRIIEALRDAALSKSAIDRVATLARKRIEQERKRLNQSGDTARQRLTEIDREIGRLTDAIAMTGMSRAIQERLAKAEAERETLLAATPQEIMLPDFLPRALDRYRELAESLGTKLPTGEVRRVIASIVGEMVIVADGSDVYAECRNLYHGLLKVVSGNGSGDRIWYPATPLRIRVSR